ncbi:chitotriosidase-1 [Drosophila takahashii]|uniref:chitotriosidase-1 n=1 Tax=Drosophila takahashii TaxID=29030 RepID=UPI001CF83387|nr:chitotriosidase-1 [Drosophila takahashii]
MWQFLIVLACLLPGHQSVFLEECKGVIINKVTNENQECSEFVHCDGDDSYYCNGDCREAVECYNQEVTTKAPAPPITTPRPAFTTTEEEPPPPENSTSTTKTPSIAPTSSTTPIPSNDIRVICKTSGRNGVYPYPANSNYYYQCISGYLLLQQCPQNFHFDAAQGQCIYTKPNRSSVLHS